MDHVFRRRRLAGIASTTALLLAVAVPTSAHVYVTDGEAIVGGGYGTEFTFRVPHGCDGAATTAIEVQIPAGVTGVKPKLMVGWTIDVVSTAPVLPSMAPDASFPDEQLDAMKAPVVTSVKWSGGSLPDSQYADFQLSAIFPEAPGTVAFPTVQSCADAQVAWIEIPAAGQDPETLAHLYRR
ncbi:MAG: YcnI family protein [Chloroflexi bacterium]|nr:YcnI family protein [Chloroflexota bacterium]